MTLGGRAVRMLCVGLVAALMAALTAVLPTTAAHAADVVVWPEVEDINPKLTPYTITVSDVGGAGNLVARWNAPRPGTATPDFPQMLLPHEGTVSLPFDETFVKNGPTRVTVYRCEGAAWDPYSCVGLAISPLVRVWVEAAMTVGHVATVGSAPKTVALTYSPTGTGTTTWRILAADGSEVVSGRVEPGGQLILAVPPGTPEQSGTLELVSSLDGTVVGHLDGRTSIPIKLDGIPPPVPRISLSDSVLYPHRDGYKDDVEVGTAVRDDDSVVLRAEDQDTGTSYLVEDFGTRVVGLFVFTGRTDRGIRIPAGNYRLRLISTDAGGDSSVLSQPIALHWERLVNRTFEQTVPAAKTVIKKYVGRCSTLRKPALPGWSGSLGYYSGTRCRDAKHAYVQVIHGLHIPESALGDYGHLRISLIGGPNPKLPDSYVVLGYYNNDKKWKFEYREDFRGGRVHAHPGSLLRGAATKDFIHQGTNGPFVAWSTGLSSGSRYDVKSFRVQIGYQALVPTGA